jgi:hypothetical protein
MTCPVCQRRDLPAEISVCPQCDADLSGMQLVAELQAVSAQPLTVVASPSRLRAWGPLAVGAVALLGSGLLIGKGIGSANPPSIVSTTVVAPKPEPIPPVAAAPTSPIQSTAESVAPEAEAGAFTYVVTLRGIAWRLYGKASMADRLGKENGIKEPRRLAIGRRLRVFSI